MGKITYPNGDYYEGMMQENKKNGNGKYFNALKN